MTSPKIKPLPGPQTMFIKSPVREVGYGGQAGGAKSFGVILDALHQLDKPGYDAILFRRTYKQLKEAGGLIDLSWQVYPHLGGEYNKSDYTWTFPLYHNNTIRLSHLQHETDIEGFSGSQYPYVAFDELQNFSERQYLFMFSRNRSSNPDIKPYIRSTFNPGGIGHYWVKKRFIDTEIKKPKWFLRINGTDTEVDKNTQFATNRLFIPSRLEDNPYLYQGGNGDYEAGLNQLDDVDYRRLRLGDWNVKREGRVYHQFSADNVVSTDVVNLEQCEYYIGIDFGAVNEALAVLAYDGNCYYLCHEEVLPPGTTSGRAQRVLSILGGRQLIAGYGGAKSERQQRYDYFDNGLELAEPVNPDIEGQINQVNEAFSSGKLKVFNTMTKTITQLDNCVRDENEGIIEKSSWHHLDALRYAVSGISNSVEVVSLANIR